jgi:hypothetical protein
VSRGQRRLHAWAWTLAAVALAGVVALGIAERLRVEAALAAPAAEEAR